VLLSLIVLLSFPQCDAVEIDAHTDSTSLSLRKLSTYKNEKSSTAKSSASSARLRMLWGFTFGGGDGNEDGSGNENDDENELEDFLREHSEDMIQSQSEVTLEPSSSATNLYDGDIDNGDIDDGDIDDGDIDNGDIDNGDIDNISYNSSITEETYSTTSPSISLKFISPNTSTPSPSTSTTTAASASPSASASTSPSISPSSTFSTSPTFSSPQPSLSFSSPPTTSPSSPPSKHLSFVEREKIKAQEDEEDFVQIVQDPVARAMAVIFAFVSIIGMLVTAQQLLEKPDGICANFCRLSLKAATLCMKCCCIPCSLLCGYKPNGYTGTDQTNRAVFLQAEEYTDDLEMI